MGTISKGLLLVFGVVLTVNLDSTKASPLGGLPNLKPDLRVPPVISLPTIQPPPPQLSQHYSTFKNPLSSNPTLGNRTPFVHRHTDGYYYFITVDEKVIPQPIIMMRSRRPTEWDEAYEERKVIFTSSAPYNHIYEPEVHQVGNDWVIYFAMEVDEDVTTSRTFVIQSNGGANPIDAQYGQPIQMKAVGEAEGTTSFHGTLLKYSDDELYYVWASDTKRAPSSDPNANNTRLDTISLFIAPLSSPSLISGPAVVIRAPTRDWEKFVVETPQVLHSPNGKSVFLAYFAGEFDHPDSCVGMIRIDHGFSPLVEDNWQEYNDGNCVLWKNEKQKVYQLGRFGFTTSPDGSESWILYTATESSTPVEHTRSLRAERFAWNDKGEPVFPRPAGIQTLLKKPKEIRLGGRPQISPPVSSPVSPPIRITGGLSEKKEPTDHVRGLVDKLSAEIHAEACKKLGVASSDASCTKEGAGQLTVIEFKEQVVAGKNYYVKVKGHANKIWHTRIFEQSWTQTLQLTGLDGPKTETDEIQYFE